MPFLVEHQQRDGGNRFCHGVDAVKGVTPHGQILFAIGFAPHLVEDHLPVAGDDALAADHHAFLDSSFEAFVDSCKTLG